jgi:thioesterase domain-containing protein
MKIGFLLGWSDISGGANVILEYGSRLQRRGHDVTILTKEDVSPAPDI